MSSVRNLVKEHRWDVEGISFRGSCGALINKPCPIELLLF